MIRIALPVLTLLLALATPARADEAAVTRRATELRETAGDQGRSIAALPAQAALTRTSERQGPWVRVRTADGATGWVHLFDIGPATAAPPADSGGGVVGGALRGVTSLFGGNRPQQTATTAGSRGLGAEDLAQAHPNPAAVAQMERLRQTEADARAFADAAALRPVVVAPLAAPAATSQPAAGGNPQQSP
jgi:hypothetical protein